MLFGLGFFVHYILMANNSNPDTPSATSHSEQIHFPNILLKATLNKRKQFNVAHLNAQSILPKIDEIRLIFADVNIHAICISETWMKKYILNNTICLSGFNVYIEMIDL